MIWEKPVSPDAIAKALAITKPIPYTPNGVWEETVQNVADALGLEMNTPERESFTATAGVEKPTPDLLDEVITEGQYSPWTPYDQPIAPEGYGQ
jgi:hypothetical protein